MASLKKVKSYFKYAAPIYSGYCIRCGKLFYCKSSRFLPSMCSPKCANLSRRKRISLNCLVCHKTFSIQHCLFRQNKRHFCSSECWYKFFRGKNCHLWKGGIKPDSPSKRYNRIMVNGKAYFEHRFIMEKHIGRKLKSFEHVHHINNNGKDNKIENLQLLTESEHHKLHHKIKTRLIRILETLKNLE